MLTAESLTWILCSPVPTEEEGSAGDGAGPAAGKDLVRRRGWLGRQAPRGHVSWLPARGVQWARVRDSLTCQTCRAGGGRAGGGPGTSQGRARLSQARQAGLGGPGSCPEEKGGGA